MKKLYISAPISGGEPEERRKFFAGVAREAAERGWQPINPMDNGLDTEAPWRQHMRKGIRMMLECDAIILMSGWQFSRGCRLEEIVAREIGLEVIDHEKWGMPFAGDSFKFNSTTFSTWKQ